VVDLGTPKVAIIVDPLDGSFNALNGIPLYAMSLALADLPPRLGNVRLGYIRNLVNGDEYVAIKGKGASCNGRPIHTSEKGRPEVLAFEFSKDKLDVMVRTMGVISDSRRIRCLGTIALSMCFVASVPEAGAIGFLEVSLRAWAEGCRTQPVGYLEGWFVVPEWRHLGVGAALAQAGEAWASQHGCLEMGSDTEVDNDISWLVHRRLGYQEVERSVSFYKPL